MLVWRENEIASDNSIEARSWLIPEPRNCMRDPAFPVFSLDACVQGFRDEWTYVSVAGDQSFISLMTQKSEQC